MLVGRVRAAVVRIRRRGAPQVECGLHLHEPALPLLLGAVAILVALLAGPWVAALMGLITNLVLGVSDPTLIAFARSTWR